MISEVRLAAWIPAIRATPSTSPLPIVPARTALAVAISITTMPLAIATRSVSGLAPTSTMRAAPAASKWVSPNVEPGCGGGVLLPRVTRP